MLTWIAENIGGPAIVIFIGAIIAALGAFWATQQQSKFEKELREKSDKIADLSAENSMFVTGGNSFCYVIFTKPDVQSNSSLIMLMSDGKYPLYDVNVRIVDLAKFSKLVKELPKPTIEDITKSDYVFNVGNLTPNHATHLGRINLPNMDEANFNIFITARNGSMNELLRMKRVAGEWFTAIKIHRLEGPTQILLMEKIDDKFPKNSEGKVDW